MKLISKLSDRERLLFYFSAAAVIVFLVYRLVFSAIIDRTDLMDGEIETLQADLQEYRQVMMGKERIVKETERYKSYLEKDPAPEVKLQTDMNAMALDAGLTIMELKPVVVRDPAKRSVELVAEGKMDGLAKLLYNLSIKQAVLKVEKMDLVAKVPKTDNLKISVVVSRTTVE